eukprot:196334-Heterocapsa_arctica.AAC.1
MKYCASLQCPVDFVELNAEGRQKSTLLYNLLVQLVQGRALSILRGIEEASGPEVWRQLQAEYEPRQAARYARMLKGVLAPTWTTSATFEVDIRAWEAALRLYEEAACVTMPGKIKCAVVAQHVPNNIEEFLKM